MKLARWWWLGGGVLAVVGLVYWFMTTSDDPLVTAVGRVDRSASALQTQSVVLHFGSKIAPALVSEVREVATGVGIEERVGHAVAELLRGPAGPAEPLFNSEAFVRGVFLSAEGDLAINFTDLPFRSEQSEIRRALAIVSLMRLLDEHFPEVTGVTLLVDGTELADLEPQLAVPAGASPRAWLTDVRVG